MSDFDSLYQRSLYLSPDQQDLLFAALASSDQFTKGQDDATYNPMHSLPRSSPQDHKHSNGSSGPELLDSPSDEAAGSGQMEFKTDESPFLDFDLDADFDFNGNGAMIGDLPGSASLVEDSEPREKRKSIDGQDSGEEESGKKRKEGEDKIAKKPGRKPLTSEPPNKRKAQNRAAQRAFRERKEKHLKDLETKVEDLETASQSVNNENSMLRAQVQRLQVELKEYRKRLSWASSGNSISTSSNLQNRAGERGNNSRGANEFTFEFPKFGDVSNSQPLGNGSRSKAHKSSNSPSMQLPQHAIPGIMARNSTNGSQAALPPSGFSSLAAGQVAHNGQDTRGVNQNNGTNNGVHAFYDPSTALGGRGGSQSFQSDAKAGPNLTEKANNANYASQGWGPSSGFSTDSPSASSESQHGHISSICTSPEPALMSPQQSGQNKDHSQSGEKVNLTPDECQQAFYTKLEEACGCAEDPVPVAFSRANHKLQSQQQQPQLQQQQQPQPQQQQQQQPQTSSDTNDFPSFDWLALQNGGDFDPVLFNDYREPQDAILTHDFGSFFDDAFPLPDFDLNNDTAPKTDLIGQVDSAQAAEKEEVVPGEDRSKMLTCTKIWDRLQADEKFRNGEVDVDNLCSELRNKARCSEGGVVINQNDVESIITRVG